MFNFNFGGTLMCRVECQPTNILSAAYSHSQGGTRHGAGTTGFLLTVNLVPVGRGKREECAQNNNDNNNTATRWVYDVEQMLSTLPYLTLPCLILLQKLKVHVP